MASRRLSRLGKTVQLTDTGITPGSGVGNFRKTIDKTTLGVPVISLGVPTVVDGNTIMHTKDEGVAEVTVTATYNDIVASNVITINVGEQASVEGVSVLEAINAQKGEEVQVQGVVAASLVNQKGFYLIDETGGSAYNTVDASLWFFTGVYNYYLSTKDKKFLKQIYPKLLLLSFFASL